MSPPVLAVLSHGPLVPAGHLTFVASFACGAHFNGGVLERRGRHRHLVAALHRFSDNEPFIVRSRESRITWNTVRVKEKGGLP